MSGFDHFVGLALKGLTETENSESDLGPCQIFMMELFLKMVNGFKPLTIFGKFSIINI